MGASESNDIDEVFYRFDRTMIGLVKHALSGGDLSVRGINYECARILQFLINRGVRIIADDNQIQTVHSIEFFDYVYNEIIQTIHDEIQRRSMIYSRDAFDSPTSKLTGQTRETAFESMAMRRDQIMSVVDSSLLKILRDASSKARQYALQGRITPTEKWNLYNNIIEVILRRFKLDTFDYEETNQIVNNIIDYVPGSAHTEEARQEYEKIGSE